MSERGNRISFLLVGAAPFGKEETGTFRSTLHSTLSVALSAVGYSPGYHPCSTLGFKPSREGDNQGRSRRLNNLPVCGRHRFGFTVGGCALCSWRLSLCGRRCLALCSRRCLTLRGCLSNGIIRRSLRSWRLRGLASRFSAAASPSAATSAGTSSPSSGMAQEFSAVTEQSGTLGTFVCGFSRMLPFIINKKTTGFYDGDFPPSTQEDPREQHTNNIGRPGTGTPKHTTASSEP